MGYPHFDQVQDADFAPALLAGMALHWREVDVILSNPAPPSFANTVEALERAGRLLGRTQTLLGGLSAVDNNPARQTLQQRFAPELAAHRDRVLLDPRHFARLDALLQSKPKLDAEQQRLLERMHRNLRRAGAQLPAEQQQRLRAINGELAQMGAEFNRKVLAGVNASAVFVSDRAELKDLSDAEIEALKQADGRFKIALQNTTGQPLLERLQHRPLRERLHQASIARGSAGDANDTTALVSRFAALRAERAALLGYATHADFELEVQTAKEVKTVNQLLRQLAPAAVAKAREEQALLQQLADREQDHAGQPRFALQAWDWAYYSERQRAVQHGYDGEQLRPYLELQNVLERGVFHAATQLFGITFKRRHDLPTYHPDVQTWEVFGPNGKTRALLLLDFYARPSKGGGAWANGYVRQSHLFGEQPVVGNHMNIPKPAPGQPTLLTWDQANTLFHEFGHNLHSILSDIRYPGLAGTPRDYVEYPSQVNEMWQSWPSVFKHYARHHQTGEAMPEALLQKVLGAKTFNQGFATTEYLAATVLDQRWHQLKSAEVPKPDQVMAFEARVLSQEGFGPEHTLVTPRYRTPYFSHMVGGYSAGYYSYLWSELLDATTVEWIEKHGGLNRATGEALRRHVLSIGGSKDIMAEFQKMVGTPPQLDPYLRRRGLQLR
ncbi:M3 family metallopeptidase [Inhella gelatinilytica]|uniref:M3 family metallopeptidase n=1 Tax=Inhella gelatinilytica TaxID=2795030 RepID=UPI001FE4E841|nr:M3 family metallopeptidase [Inhella gelatinilytica]